MALETVQEVNKAYQPTLAAFARALGREAHVLTRQPDLLWQQLYNRLQWESPPIAGLLSAGRAARTRPWIHRYSRLRESEALVRTLTGHTERVNACAVSPNGAWIVSASWDKTLKIWDAATGAERATLTGHTGGVLSCAVSPDGAWIVSASADQTLKIWDVDPLTGRSTTGLARATLTGHNKEVNGCVVSPDGAWIISAGQRDGLKIWDAGLLTRHSVPAIAVDDWNFSLGLKGCAVSPDGAWIVAAGRDKTLKIWDIVTLAEGGAAFADSARLTLAGHQEQVNACAVSPDGAWIVSGSGYHSGPTVFNSSDNTLRIWDAATGVQRATLTGHTEQVNACGVSPEGAWIVSAGGDHTLRVWDVKTGEKRAILTGHTGEVRGCAFSPDGAWIVSASWDHTLKIWDAAVLTEGSAADREAPYEGSEHIAPKGHTGRVNACAVGLGGARAFSVGGYTLKTWDTTTSQRLDTVEVSDKEVKTCAVSPDGNRIVFGGNDFTLRIWDLTGGPTSTLDGHTGWVNACAFSPDGAWIVSAYVGGALKIWDAETPVEPFEKSVERRTLTGHTRDANGCAVSPDGAWIVSASDDASLKIWDAGTGKNQATLTGHTGPMKACAVSPDGAWIVSAGADSSLKIWDAGPTGRSASLTESSAARGGTPNQVPVWATLTGHTGPVLSCAVSPDGAWIASAGDHTVRIWDATAPWKSSSRAVLVLPGEATTVAFHPFEPMIVCGDAGGAIHLARLVGIEFGPLVVSAAMQERTLFVRCPACRQRFPIDKEGLGSEITCPQPGCNTRLQVNPFLIKPAPRSGNWLSKLFKK